MIKKYLLLALLSGAFFSSAGQDALEQYVNRLRQSAISGGSETAFLSVGSKFLYGQDYFEKKEYTLANMYFNQAYQVDSTNAFVNYQIAASLLKQNDPQKTVLAQKYLQNAFLLNPGLKNTYENQFPVIQKPSTTADQQRKPTVLKNKVKIKKNNTTTDSTSNESNKPQTSTVPKSFESGKLVFGNYVCTQSIWKGPNRTPAYSYVQKGYFELKNDGTYRWLDNGGTGKYSYNQQTGEIKWLSGHLFNMKIKNSSFEKGKKVSQITLNFSSDYRWECGCNNK
ncbi:MAG: hypothetical protein ABIN04_08540 [Ginsengibacter sp.]